MKLNKTFALVALVAGSLFAGTALQAQDSTNAPAGEKHPGGPGGLHGRPNADMIAKDLGLTDDQKAKVKAALEDTQLKMKALRDDTSLSKEDKKAKFKEIREANQAKMKEILTPEQYEKWQKKVQEHRPAGGSGGQGGKPPKQD
jgi:Spy/CpxP family protein refolding chaperone